VTLFQISDLNSRHVRGASPANLDSERGWRILRERRDVYPYTYPRACAHVCPCRENMVNYVDRVCCRIPPDPTYRYRCPTDNENAHPCLEELLEELLLHSSRFSLRVRDRRISSTSTESHARGNFVPVDLGLSRKSRISLHGNDVRARTLSIVCIFSPRTNVRDADEGTRPERRNLALLAFVVTPLYRLLLRRLPKNR